MRYLSLIAVVLVAACGSKSEDKPAADAGAGQDAVALADGATAADAAAPAGDASATADAAVVADVASPTDAQAGVDSGAAADVAPAGDVSAASDDAGSKPVDLAAACSESGGKVEVAKCCGKSPEAANDFPNSCLIGACGCSPDNSVDTKVCVCPAGKCFDGKACVSASN